LGLFWGGGNPHAMCLAGGRRMNPPHRGPGDPRVRLDGFGVHYADWIGQITYTTPDIGGFNFSIGIFDPLEPILQGAPTPEGAPGFHGKVSYTREPFYLSATFITQEHEGLTDAADFDSQGFDVGGKVTFGPGEFSL